MQTRLRTLKSILWPTLGIFELVGVMRGAVADVTVIWGRPEYRVDHTFDVPWTIHMLCGFGFWSVTIFAIISSSAAFPMPRTVSTDEELLCGATNVKNEVPAWAVMQVCLPEGSVYISIIWAFVSIVSHASLSHRLIWQSNVSPTFTVDGSVPEHGHGVPSDFISKSGAVSVHAWWTDWRDCSVDILLSMLLF